MPRTWLGFGARALEPWLLAMVALGMAALEALGAAGTPSWVLAGLAAGAAAWPAHRPARHQADVTLRLLLLLLAGAAVRWIPGPAVDVAFVVWHVALPLVAGLLLRPEWAAAVAGMAVASVLLGPTRQPVSLEWACAAGAFLVALQAGALLRARDWRRHASHVDPSTGLFSRRGLVAFGDDLLGDRAQRPAMLAMAVFDCEDLAEVGSVCGLRVARALRRRLVGRLTAIAGPRGLVGRTGPTQFAVVLPGMTLDQALARIQQELGSPPRLESERGGQEIVLVPQLAVESTCDEVVDCGELYALLNGRLARVRDNEQRRQRHLRRSRERHTTPPPSVSLDQLVSQPVPMASEPARLRAAG